MKTMHDAPDDTKLRLRAENVATEAGGTELPSEMSPEKMESLIHELQVHQIELKLQNDELRQIQGELEKTRDRYGHLYDFAPVGYFTVSQDGVIDRANLTIAAMLGIDRSALIGQPFTRFVLNDDQDAFYKYRQRLLETETPQPCELRFVKKDGRVLYTRLECTVITNGREGGKRIRGAVIDVAERKRAEDELLKYRDHLEDLVNERTAKLAQSNQLLQTEITERKRVEAALIESEKRFRNLAETTSDWIWEVDKNGVYTYVSPKIMDLLGYVPEEILGKTPFDLMSHEEAKRVSNFLSGVIASQKPFDGFENINLHKNGQAVALETSGVPIFDAGGEFHGYRGIDRDVTERKQADEQIKSSLKEKEALLSEVHHRVKNNMQIITSLLRLQSSKIDDKRYAEMFKDTEYRIKSMALIHEKLYQTKDFAKIDFKDYAKSIANHLQRSYSAAAHKIKLNLNIEDIPIGLDKAIPCGLIINELLSNSLKYAFPKGEEGEIKIVLRAINSDEVELTVSDDGIGISKEIDIGKSESLGLELVHILAENQLDGTLAVDREKGAAFKIRFKNH